MKRQREQTAPAAPATPKKRQREQTAPAAPAAPKKRQRPSLGTPIAAIQWIRGCAEALPGSDAEGFCDRAPQPLDTINLIAWHGNARVHGTISYCMDTSPAATENFARRVAQEVLYIARGISGADLDYWQTRLAGSLLDSDLVMKVYREFRGRCPEDTCEVKFTL